MEKEEIYNKLTVVFHNVFNDDDLKLTPEMTASDVDEWDSLSHIRLVVAVEKAFGLKFSAAEVGPLKNVGEFADLIRRKQ